MLEFPPESPCIILRRGLFRSKKRFSKMGLKPVARQRPAVLASGDRQRTERKSGKIDSAGPDAFEGKDVHSCGPGLFIHAHRRAGLAVMPLVEPASLIQFSKTLQRALSRGSFNCVPALERAATEYLDERNHDPRPFVWTADADLVIQRVQRNCERISRSGH